MNSVLWLSLLEFGVDLDGDIYTDNFIMNQDGSFKFDI